MIQLLTGENTFTRQEAYDALRASHDSDGSLAANSVTFYGKTLKLPELEAAAMAVPFLADYRLVRVDGLCDRFGARTGRRRADVAAWDGLLDLLQALPDSTLLIFIDGKTTDRNPIREMIAQAGQVREFPPMREREVQSWLHDRARALGLHLTPGAERLLVTRVGHDLWTLASELQKIEIYAGNATVDEAVVESLAPINHESNIFQFVDAVAEGRTTQAMQALAALRQAGETPQRILNMIARQIRMIAVARELLDQGRGEDDIRQALGAHPFVARRAANQARRYNQATADAALRRVLDCDLAIQNYRNDRPGAMRDGQALELLVADLAGPARRSASSSRQPASR
jgi:DNA polymerase-3 subunit delta